MLTNSFKNMDCACTHLEDDAEHLLLDDDNVVCLKCRKNNFPNGNLHNDLSTGKLIIEHAGYYDPRTDNSEDSPLLVNVNVSIDCYWIKLIKEI